MEITEKTRHLTASAVVIDPAEGSVLLVHHLKSDRWVFPGGHVDADEAPHEAAMREVLEETGVTAVLSDRPTGMELPAGAFWHPVPFVVAEFPAPGNPEWSGGPAEPPHHHIDFLYLATADSELPTQGQADEVGGVRWVPIYRLGSLVRSGGLNIREEVRQVAAAALLYLVGNRSWS